MPNQRNDFPGPRYNQTIDQDKQIISVPLETVDWGARPVTRGQVSVKNSMSLKHIRNEA